MSRKAYVVAISAVSGGGKSSVTKQLSYELPHAKALFFDEYEFDPCPDDICDWVERGADFNEFNLAPLTEEIENLLNDNDEPLSFILLDYPFAYLHPEVKKYINLAVYIDTPLDLAMARRISRDYASKTMNDLIADLRHYTSRGRAAYVHMEETVKPNSDLVVDGSLPIAAIVEQVLKEIFLRLKESNVR